MCQIESFQDVKWQVKTFLSGGVTDTIWPLNVHFVQQGSPNVQDVHALQQLNCPTNVTVTSEDATFTDIMETDWTNIQNLTINQNEIWLVMITRNIF